MFVPADDRHCSVADKLAAVSVHRDVGDRNAQTDLEPKHRRPETSDRTEEVAKRRHQPGLLPSGTSRILGHTSAVSEVHRCGCCSAGGCYRGNGKQLRANRQAG